MSKLIFEMLTQNETDIWAQFCSSCRILAPKNKFTEFYKDGIKVYKFEIFHRYLKDPDIKIILGQILYGAHPEYKIVFTDIKQIYPHLTMF